MNILVTGGAGYIGSVTVEQLIGKGHNVVVLDNLSRGHRKAVHGEAKLIVGDVGSAQIVGRIIKDFRVEAIMHFAADSQVGESMENPGKYFSNNVCQGLELIKTASENKINKFILSSTSATYGEPTIIPIPEPHSTKPTNPYGESKLILEQALKWYYACKGMEYVSLRYFNACGASLNYGEDHTPETHIIPVVLNAAYSETGAVNIFGDDYPTADGTCVRDYVHVLDLAKAHILALSVNGSNIYNLGNGNGFSVKEVVSCAEKVTGRQIPVKISGRRAGDPARLVASSDKIRAELGWEPEYSSLEKIIQTAWDWKLKNPNGYEG